MSEADIIAATAHPHTRESLGRDLIALGICAGDVLVVHSSLKALGWVAGGPVAVIQALIDALGPAGTLAMPAHSSNWTDPALWQMPPVPDEWVATIRAHMPAYDPATTPTRGMGRIAELFRTWPGTQRSNHPATSFAARGPLADTVLAGHSLDTPHGEASPLARLYDAGAKVLLLGVGFERCTMLHLAEHRAWPQRALHAEGAAIMVDGQRRWVTYSVPGDGSDHFPPFGETLLAYGIARKGKVGNSTSILLPARAAVDRAVEHWRNVDPATLEN